MQFLNMQEADRVKYITAALTCIGDGLIITDRQGRVQYINQAGERLTGWSNEEAAGRSFGEVFPLVDYFTGEPLESPLPAAIQSKDAVGLRNHSALAARNGRTLFLSASCSPICLEDWGISGTVTVFRDINRIKSIEYEIEKEKNNLKNVLEALPTGILLVGEGAVVKWVNQPVLDMFHITKEHVIGRCFGDATHCIYSLEKGCGNHERCRFCEIRQNIIKGITEDRGNMDVVIKRSFLVDLEEHCYWLQINFIPLTTTEEKQIVIAIEDITEQKNYEEVLQRSRDEAESANRIKSEFIANMSHEIRTPLNGLIGMMELLKMTDTDSVQKEYIRMAKQSADSLLRVINDILDISKMEAGKISISNINFDILELMEEIIKIHRVLADSRKLKLIYEVSPDTPGIIRGDPDRFRQILNNLIGNAIKFTKRGQVRIDLRTADQNGPYTRLEFVISDTGIGISEEKMNLLFKRFSQVDSSNTRRYSGTGLGLAISKQLAELMGGTILAESVPGQGSTFRFITGCNTVNTVQDPELQSAEPAAPIFVDDSEINNVILPRTAQAGRIIIMENQTEEERCSRVRLDENGEIIFDRQGTAAARSEIAAELHTLEQLFGGILTMLEEGRFAEMEEPVHMVKKAALRIDDDTMMDLAFRAELSLRKNKWEAAADYCRRMIGEFNTRYKED